MSSLTFSLDDSLLYSQLFDLKQSVDNSNKQLIDKILNLSRIELLIIFIVYALGQTNSKKVGEEVFINRRTAGKYMKKLAEQDNLLGFVQTETANSEFPGVINYFVLEEATKMVLGSATGVVQSIDLNNNGKNGHSSVLSVDSSMENTSENTHLILYKIRQFHQSLANKPTKAKEIFYLLNDIPQSIKQISKKIGCDKTTASKYLKNFFDLGIADREIAPSSSVGRGEFLYFLNPDVSKVLSKVKNEHQAQLEFEDSDHIIAQNTTASISNVKICLDSEGINMGTESFQQQSTSQPVDKNATQGFDPLAYKIKEFIKLINQVETIEEELRDLLGPGTETEIAITRLKSKKL